MRDPEEVALLRSCQAGDEAAFREIVEKYQRRTYWIAHNMLNSYERAKDISQEAFIRVFRNIHRFDLTKNFYTWLYQIVVNLCIDHLRKIQRGQAVALEDLGGIPDRKPGPADHSQTSDMKGQVRAALNRLPAKYGAILTLRDIQGFDCEEIAAIVGCTNATVRWRLHRARKLFKALWEGKEGVEVPEEEDSGGGV